MQINEGISDIVYHYSGIDSILKMVTEDSFFLSPVGRNSADFSAGKKKSYFLSTTRSKIGRYTLGQFFKGNFNAVIEIDGRKLSQNYSGEPVDYWGPQFRKADPTYNEMEDRIYSDTAKIPFKRYVIAIHIFIPEDNDNNYTKRRLKALIFQCKKKGIELKFYDTEQNFFAQRNSVPLDLSKVALKGDLNRFGREYRAFENEDARAILRLLEKDDYTHIVNKEDEVAYKWLGRIRYDSTYDNKRRIEIMFSEKRSETQATVEKIFRIMRKNKLATIEDLIAFLKEKITRLSS